MSHALTFKERPDGFDRSETLTMKRHFAQTEVSHDIHEIGVIEWGHKPEPITVKGNMSVKAHQQVVKFAGETNIPVNATGLDEFETILNTFGFDVSGNLLTAGESSSFRFDGSLLRTKRRIPT
jgi:hypothetical protein